MSTPYTKTVERRGLVVGFCHDIGFAEIIDNVVDGASPERNLSCGK